MSAGVNAGEWPHPWTSGNRIHAPNLSSQSAVCTAYSRFQHVIWAEEDFLQGYFRYRWKSVIKRNCLLVPKVELSLCLFQRMPWSCFLILGTGLRWMVCLMLRPLRLWGNIHLRYWIRGWIVPSAGLDSDTLRLPGIEIRIFGGLASGLAANSKLQRSTLTRLWVWNEFRIKEYHWEEIWICFLVFCPIHICRTLSWNTRENFYVQSVSGGKVNILGGDNIGHCENKSSYEQVSNSEWLPR
jgi:hypothetical protein